VLTEYVFSPAAHVTFLPVELKISGWQANGAHVIGEMERLSQENQRHVVVNRTAVILFVFYNFRNTTVLEREQFVFRLRIPFSGAYNKFAGCFALIKTNPKIIFYYCAATRNS
jgi:hypothetical protein